MSPWRKLLYKELGRHTFHGTVLDIGGSRLSAYHERFGGVFKVEVVNIDPACNPDYTFSLEEAFPLGTGTYNAVLGINVLEHLYTYENVVQEVFRILRPDGRVLFAVPFLMFVHPSPNDYFRYTAQALERILREVGFVDIEVVPVGRGPGAVFVQTVGGLKGGVMLRTVVAPCMYIFDWLFGFLLPQGVLRERFPLGYVVKAKKV